jgi:hypothetical protein
MKPQVVAKLVLAVAWLALAGWLLLDAGAAGQFGPNATQPAAVVALLMAAWNLLWAWAIWRKPRPIRDDF